jgi:hypothetical protein
MNMSAAPTLNCPHCNQSMQYVAELAGQDAVCPTCGKIFNVPTVEQTVTVTNSTVSQGPPASATSPFGGGDTPVKPLPPQYAHLKKDAKGVHTTKIVWLCLLAIVPSLLWLGFIILSAFYRD